LLSLSALFFLATVITIVRQPMRAIYKNVLTALAYLFFAAGTASRAARLLLLDDAASQELGSTVPPEVGSVAAFRVATICTIVQLALVGLRAFLDGLFTYLESHVWRPRNPQYLRSLEDETRARRRAAKAEMDEESALSAALLGANALDDACAGSDAAQARSGAGSDLGGDDEIDGHSEPHARLEAGDVVEMLMRSQPQEASRVLSAAELEGLRGEGGPTMRRIQSMRTINAAEAKKRSERVSQQMATSIDHEANIEWLLGGQRSRNATHSSNEGAPKHAKGRPPQRIVRFQDR
jgi:hypothetical protein